MKFIISLFKMNIKKFEILLAFVFIFNIISFTIADKNFLMNKNNLKNKQVLIPDSKDPNGGQYVISCQVCQKIIHKYINNCVTQEAEGYQADTLLSYCESLRKPTSDTTQQNKIMNSKYDLCIMLNDRISIETGEKSSDLVDPTKHPGLCMKYKNGNIVNINFVGIIFNFIVLIFKNVKIKEELQGAIQDFVLI
jgi:hypothetical protein